MRPSRLFSPPGTYFITSSTWHHRRLFQAENNARLFLKTLYHYRREGRYFLHAFVLMPDHIHLLLTPSQDVTIERAIQLIKGAYSHELGTLIGGKSEIWQRGFTDHRIRDAQDFIHHRHYIHQNPVVARLVCSPSEYRYSSGFPGFKLDPWPPAAEAAVVGGRCNRHEWNSCPSRFSNSEPESTRRNEGAFRRFRSLHCSLLF